MHPCGARAGCFEGDGSIDFVTFFLRVLFDVSFSSIIQVRVCACWRRFSGENGKDIRMCENLREMCENVRDLRVLNGRVQG